MSEYLPEGKLINTPQNRAVTHSLRLLREAVKKKTILEARAGLCDASHNLCVQLGGIRGMIPREEGALGMRDGTVRDIAVISRVNRPVCFTVTAVDEDSEGLPYALLSRADAQERCLQNYIADLRCGDVIDARITHLESFGAFADIGCGIAALMPIDAISVSRISHPRDRLTVGMDVKAVVKSIENGRISLSQKELLGTWEQNAAGLAAGETVAGIVRSVENYGAFVELTPNLAGLAETKEGIRVGQQVSVYIKSIIPDKMKIKLIIIDAFDDAPLPSAPVYFTDAVHIDRFLYSPVGCQKNIETVFEKN